MDFLPDIACSRGRIRRPGATCEPATGKFSHNTHIQACHVQLAPQIFSATVLFSAPLSRKHSCRVIGASWRSHPTVSDGETTISNTLPMRISRGKPSRPVSRLPSPTTYSCLCKHPYSASATECQQRWHKLAPSSDSLQYLKQLSSSRALLAAQDAPRLRIGPGQKSTAAWRGYIDTSVWPKCRYSIRGLR